jgi:hypothetical protein
MVVVQKRRALPVEVGRAQEADHLCADARILRRSATKGRWITVFTLFILPPPREVELQSIRYLFHPIEKLQLFRHRVQGLQC